MVPFGIHFQKYVTFGLLLSFFAGCGPHKVKESGPVPPQVLPQITSRDRPQSYMLADENCQRRFELHTNPLPLTEAWIQRVGESGVTSQWVDLEGVQTETSLKSLAVYETTYGELYRRVCDFRKTKQMRCRESSGLELPFIREAPPKNLKICRDRFEYPEESYEAIALTSIYGLDRTLRTYNTRAPEDSGPAIPPVSLSVLPTFEEVFDYFPSRGTPSRLTTYLTHNLAYFPEVYEVVVFPEPESQADDIGRQNLWESPFVLAHEYGHHIDHIRHGDFYKNARLAWSPLEHRFVELVNQDHLAPYQESSLMAEVTGQRPTAFSPRSLLTTALSEAFADLIAYYTENESSLSLRGFSDISTDRDISQTYFENGLPKKLRADYLEVFFGQFENSALKQTTLGAMTGVHTIGAVFAYGVHQFFSTMTRQANPSSQTEVLKYRLLLIWMNHTVMRLQNLGVDASEKECLKALADGLLATAESAENMEEFKTAVAQSQGAWNLALMETLNTYFPALPL